ncbi:MAG: hypothetical protein ABH950_07275 [Candidatus Altiarchaeota archaeon]
MPYAIPANVGYEEKLLGPFNLKQSIYVVIGGSILFYVFTKGENIPAVWRTIIVIVTTLSTMGFAMFNLDTYLLNIFNFIRQNKKSSWISPAARQLMNIKSIRADAVWLQDNRILGLIQVKPINFAILNEEDQKTVIYGYLEFLNSLSFPIQIVMRSVNLDLEEYLAHTKRRIIKRDDREAMSYYKHFSEYLREYIKLNRINNRLFYIVVSIPKKADEKATIEELEARCETIMNTLAISGIVAERMNTHKLINFYSSYFTETLEIFQDFLSPITMYRKLWKEKPEKTDKYKGRYMSHREIKKPVQS